MAPSLRGLSKALSSPSRLLPTSLAVLLLWLLSAARAQDHAGCFYPDGSPATGDTPCDVSVDGATTHATCCGRDFACLNNRMCKATSKVPQDGTGSLYVRGSCTDRAWVSDSCPRFCINPDPPFSDFMAGGNGIGRCETEETLFYCIDGGSYDCKAGYNVIPWDGPLTALTTIGVAAPTSSVSTATGAPDFTDAPDPTGFPGPEGGSGRDDSDNKTTVGIAVGASLGGLAVVAAGIAGWFAYRRRTRKPPAPPVSPPTIWDLPPGYPMMPEMAGPGSPALPISGGPPTPSWSMASGTYNNNDAVSAMGLMSGGHSFAYKNGDVPCGPYSQEQQQHLLGQYPQHFAPPYQQPPPVYALLQQPQVHELVNSERRHEMAGPTPGPPKAELASPGPRW